MPFNQYEFINKLYQNQVYQQLILLRLHHYGNSTLCFTFEMLQNNNPNYVVVWLIEANLLHDVQISSIKRCQSPTISRNKDNDKNISITTTSISKIFKMKITLKFLDKEITQVNPHNQVHQQCNTMMLRGHSSQIHPAHDNNLS